MDEVAGLRKALMLADRGETGRARDTLRVLLDAGPAPALRVRALVVLGDLLAADGEPGAARAALSEAIVRADGMEDADDLLDAELRRARELLGELA